MKFLLIDDHPLMRSALRTVIKGLGDDVLVIEAESCGVARDALAVHDDFDAVLLDLSLNGSDAFGLLREIRQAHPALPVMVVTASEDGRDLIRSIDNGAAAFVHKRASAQTLLQALTTVMGGGIYLPEDLSALAEPSPAQPSAASAPGSWLPSPGLSAPAAAAPWLSRIGLTPRQTDVLMLLLEGKANKVIARELNLSVETVKDHVAAVLRSLNVSSRTQAVLAVTQMTSHGPAATRRGLL